MNGIRLVKDEDRVQLDENRFGNEYSYVDCSIANNDLVRKIWFRRPDEGWSWRHTPKNWFTI